MTTETAQRKHEQAPDFIDSMLLRQFFDEEAKAEKASYDALMQLPVEGRVRKRKCIVGISLDRDYKVIGEMGERLFRITFGQNLSDFKEGERVVLHYNWQAKMPGEIYEIPDDHSMIISADAYNCFIDPYSLCGKELVLDKDTADLRPFVYNPFVDSLPADKEFWENHPVNSRPQAQLVNLEECRTELNDTISNFGIKLLPKQYEAVLHSMAAENLYLLQGPPGTGKSFVLALIMLEEMGYFKRKVAIVGPNHAAINNALEKLVELSPTMLYDYVAKIGKKYQAPQQLFEINGEQKPLRNLYGCDASKMKAFPYALALGLTPHTLYTRRGRGLKFDTIIIDEAGQESIPLAIMAMQCGKKVILAGDHKQLSPIIRNDNIPESLKSSIFGRLMNKGNFTMLDTTFRMSDPICKFVSHLFYDGKLETVKKNTGALPVSADPLVSADAPIVICDVEDSGMQASEKEAEKVAQICSDLIANGLQGDQIGILTPFRAQVAQIKRAIRNCKSIPDNHKLAIVADTVDKMQGQEREAIIYSMASGDPDYMMEMGDFLYNPQKLNVAFSRAKSKLIIAGNTATLNEVGKAAYPLLEKIVTYPHAVIVKF